MAPGEAGDSCGEAAGEWLPGHSVRRRGGVKGTGGRERLAESEAWRTRSLRLFEGSTGQSGVETSEWGTENVTRDTDDITLQLCSQ